MSTVSVLTGIEGIKILKEAFKIDDEKIIGITVEAEIGGATVITVKKYADNKKIPAGAYYLGEA